MCCLEDSPVMSENNTDRCISIVPSVSYANSHLSSICMAFVMSRAASSMSCCHCSLSNLAHFNRTSHNILLSTQSPPNTHVSCRLLFAQSQLITLDSRPVSRSKNVTLIMSSVITVLKHKWPWTINGNLSVWADLGVVINWKLTRQMAKLFYFCASD